jgi:6-phosphogluconolactonase (cycloisomerase 2 family)
MPTPNPTPVPTSPSRFVYAIIDFEASGGFFGGSIDSGTGTVTPLAANPFSNTLGQNIVIQVIADRAGRFLYSLNAGASSFGMQFGKPGINAYQINRSNGTLEPIPNGDIIFTSGSHSAQMAIDGNGKFLYEPNGSGTDLYTINQSSGLLTFVATLNNAVPLGDFSAASSDGHFFFNSGAGMVEAFSIEQSTGQLSLTGSGVPTGGSGGPMIVSSDSTMLFVANQTEGLLAVFEISSGGLTKVVGSPFPIDTQAEALSLSPDNRFLYITFGQPSSPSDVKGYQLNLAGGRVTAIAGASIANATSVDVDGSGKFAYVSLPTMQLGTFAIDPATGVLTAVSQTTAPQFSAPWTNKPTNIVLTP